MFRALYLENSAATAFHAFLLILFFYLLIDCHWLSLDPPPLRGADRKLALSTGRRAEQYYQEFAPGKASGQWK